jgi:transcriptional regulator with XRE-family HTH domain
MVNRVVALRRALDLAPASLRALAREAGVSHALLLMIVSRKRAPTPGVIVKVSQALDRWADSCERGAQLLRRAAKEER